MKVMTTDRIIDKYVEAHADCRWMDAGDLRDLLNAFAKEIGNTQDIYEAAVDLVGAVERYVRQECSRADLIGKKNKLKKLIEE